MKLLLILLFCATLFVPAPAWCFNFTKCAQGLLSLANKAVASVADVKSEEIASVISDKIHENIISKVKSLDVPMTELAQLMISLENIPAETTSYEIHMQTLLQKDKEFKALVEELGFNEAEIEYVRDILLLKRESIRRGETAAIIKEDEEEKASRKNEEDFVFGPRVEFKQIGPFAAAELQDDDTFDVGLDNLYLSINDVPNTPFYHNVETNRVVGLGDDPALRTKFINGGAEFVVVKGINEKGQMFLIFDIFNVKSLELVKKRKIHIATPLYRKTAGQRVLGTETYLALTSEGKVILDQFTDSSLRIYNLNSGSSFRARKKNNSQQTLLKLSTDEKYIGRFTHPDGGARDLFTGSIDGGDGYNFRMWRLRDSDPIARFMGSSVIRFSIDKNVNAITDFAIDTPRDRLITVDIAGAVEIWSLRNGEKISAVPQLGDNYRTIKVMPDGKIVLSLNISHTIFQNHILKIHLPVVVVDVDGTQKYYSSGTSGPNEVPLVAEISPDGQWLAAVMSDTEWRSKLQVWHVNSGTLKATKDLGKIGGQGTTKVAPVIKWSPDGHLISFRNQNTLTVWKMEMPK